MSRAVERFSRDYATVYAEFIGASDAMVTYLAARRRVDANGEGAVAQCRSCQTQFVPVKITMHGAECPDCGAAVAITTDAPAVEADAPGATAESGNVDNPAVQDQPTTNADRVSTALRIQRELQLKASEALRNAELNWQAVRAVSDQIIASPFLEDDVVDCPGCGTPFFPVPRVVNSQEAYCPKCGIAVYLTALAADNVAPHEDVSATAPVDEVAKTLSPDAGFVLVEVGVSRVPPGFASRRNGGGQ